MTDNARPVLYSFRRCPYAMRARMAIAEAGIPVRLREILLRDKPDEMLAASSKGTVPVLILPDGHVIDESLDAMHWALGQSDPDGWLSADTDKTNALIEEGDGAFKHHLDRYKYSTRYEDADAETHRSAGFDILKRWDEALSVHGQFFGLAPTLADIALFPFVRQFRIAGPDWFDAADLPALQGWLSGHMESDRFEAIMTKHPLWKETGEEIDFPIAA